MTTTANSETMLNGDVAVTAAPTCLLCGADGSTLYDGMIDCLWGVPGQWGLRQCECGLAWLHPQPCAQDIAKLYARYYTHAEVDTGRLERLRQEFLKCVLARMGYRVQPSRLWLARALSRVPSIARARALEIFDLPASSVGKLLDVGCGSGRFIRQMQSLGWDASGVDPDPAAVAYGTSQGLSVFQGTVSDAPPNSRYDVITLNHVIEHVPDPIGLLAECKKRLTPRTGRLLITTPNLSSLGHRWFGRYWRGLETPRHLVLFSVPGLRKCASEAGLSVQSLRTETRLARMIYNASACAKAGETRIGEKTDFTTTNKCAAFLFQAMEELSMVFRKDAGEEIFCECSSE